MRFSDPSLKSKDIIRELREQKNKAKNPNKKMDKKFLITGFATLAFVSSMSGLAYSYIRDAATQDNMPKNNVVQFIDYTKEHNVSRSNSDTKKWIIDTVESLRSDFVRYGDLHRLYGSSEKREAELEALTAKINKNYEIIQELAKTTSKMKIAEAYKVGYFENLTIIPPRIDTRTGEILNANYTVMDGDKAIFHGNKEDGMQISDTVTKLMDTQNTKWEEISPKKRANLLYSLYNSSIKTYNTHYIQKNGKLAEVNLNTKNIKDKSSTEEMER